MVRIRLRRMGLKHKPAYRVVIADARSPRDGKFIETIGHYNPQSQPKILMIKQDRARYWLSVGAQPSDTVVRLLKNVGVLDGEGKIADAPAPVAEVEVVSAPTKKPRSKAAAPAVEAAAPAVEAAAPAVEAAAPAVEAAAPAVEAAAPAVEAAAPAVEAAAPAVEAASFGPGSAKALADGSAPEGFTIKGNADSMLYHVVGSRYYDSTVAEVWFATPEDAEQVGFRAPGAPKA